MVASTGSAGSSAYSASSCGNGDCAENEECAADCTGEIWCGDGVDNDEDSLTDCDDDVDCQDEYYNCYSDGICGMHEGSSDCLTEVWCEDGVDNDMDETTDIEDSDCGGVSSTGSAGSSAGCGDDVCDEGEVCGIDCLTETHCGDGVNNDEDPDTDCADTDCDDGNGNCCGDDICDEGGECGADCATETWCGDGVDNDQNTMVDWEDPDCMVSSTGSAGSSAYSAPPCGDDVCDEGEACVADCGNDEWCADGVDNDEDGMTDSDDVDGAGCSCNGVLQEGEACDDGNNDVGDGCESDCLTIEGGWTCDDSEPSVCQFCGNGIVEGTETCDDGDADDGDGCSAACAIESDYTCDTSVEPTDCTVSTEDDGHGAAAANRAREEFRQAIDAADGAPADAPHGGAASGAEDAADFDNAAAPEVSAPPPPSPPTVLFDRPSQGGGAVPSRFGTIETTVLKNGAPVAPAGFADILKKLEPGTVQDGSRHAAAQMEALLTSGTPPTRAEALEILLRSLNVPIASGPIPFLDVTQATPHAAAIATATRLGLLHGDQYPNGGSRGTVRPNDPVNWSELSIILARMKRKGLLRTFPNP